jgi:hypothetical protein
MYELLRIISYTGMVSIPERPWSRFRSWPLESECVAQLQLLIPRTSDKIFNGAMMCLFLSLSKPPTTIGSALGVPQRRFRWPSKKRGPIRSNMGVKDRTSGRILVVSSDPDLPTRVRGETVPCY